MKTRSYQKWTIADDAILRIRVAADVPVWQIAEELGRPKHSVDNRKRRIGLRHPPTHFRRRGQDNRTPAHERIDQYIEPEPNTGCWLWSGATANGYGYIADWVDGDQKLIRAHRYVYEREIGPIPDGLQLDHLCRVRCCVNPSHLEPVTCQENNRRGLNGKPHHERQGIYRWDRGYAY